MSTDSDTTTDSTTSNAPVAVKPPGSELARRALWAVAVIPVGLVMAFVVAGILSSPADAPQPVVEADGRVNSVQMTWRTRHTPAQACADFRIGMGFMAGTVSDSPAGPGEACRLSADAGRVTAVVTPASPDASGAVIVTTEKRPSDVVP